MEEKTTLLLEKETKTEILQTEKIVPKEMPKKEERKVSSVIEKPNYDLIETKLEKKQNKIKIPSFLKEPSSKVAKRVKLAVCSVLMSLVVVWCGLSISSLVNVNNQITQVSTEYSLNVIRYISKLQALDNANRGKEFIEVYPEELANSSDYIIKSNFYDKMCDFLSKIFGG